MLAFNEGLLNNKTVDEIPALLHDLTGYLGEHALSLDADREQWLQWLRPLVDTGRGDD